MNDSTNEFFVLTNMNLETQESPYTASEEHWRTAARKLQLSADQVSSPYQLIFAMFLHLAFLFHGLA